MLYISDDHFKDIPVYWNETISQIGKAISCMATGDFSQPMKPYLRFKDKSNRIIAMPSYVGGNIDMAGIKWIASFPKNIENNLPRASSVTVLNNTNTGVPIAIFNTPMISVIRTASVSGYLLREYNLFKQKPTYNIGIIGFGPIGQYHLKMCKDVLNETIGGICIYDKKVNKVPDDSILVCDSWQEVYEKSDVFITCTSSLERYIDLPTQSNKLMLDVSLRDFKEEAMDSFTKPFIVDDWDEVNRENTDIEYYFNLGKISKNEIITLCDIQNKKMHEYYEDYDTIYFAPMGMSIFDITIANYYYQLALEKDFGIILN